MEIRYCSAENCESSSESVHLLAFPKNPERYKKWRQVVGGANYPSSRLCVRHFSALQFFQPSREKMLKLQIPKYRTGPLNPITNDYCPLEETPGKADESLKYDPSAVVIESPNSDSLVIIDGTSNNDPLAVTNKIVGSDSFNKMSETEETQSRFHVRYCSAEQCRSSSTSVRLMAFPRDPERNKIWREVVGGTNYARARLCVRHFAVSQFFHGDRLRLLNGQIPMYRTGPLNPKTNDYCPLEETAVVGEGSNHCVESAAVKKMSQSEENLTSSCLVKDQGLLDIPLDFPHNYSYISTEGKILVKEITDRKSALNWLKDYENSSNTNWIKARITAKSRTSGPNVKFSVQWKCHYHSQRRQNIDSKQKRFMETSKNSNCPAHITCTVSWIGKKPKDELIKLNTEYPCHLEVFLEHNHPLDSDSVKGHNTMSSVTKCKLIELFKKGHTALSAIQELKLDIFNNEVENYFLKVVDDSIVPTLDTVQHLFNGFSMSKDGTAPNRKRSMSVNPKRKASLKEKSISANRLASGTDPVSHEMSLGDVSISDSVDSERDDLFSGTENCCEPPHVLTVEQKIELKALFDRIIHGSESSPEVFVPAVQKLLKNIRTHVQTDSSLVSAMRDFGLNLKRVTVGKTKGQMIDDFLPTSNSSGKVRSRGPLKRANDFLNGLEDHDYSVLVSPKTKKMRTSNHLP